MGVEPAPLAFRQTMQGAELREIEWAPAKEAPPFLVPEEQAPQEYGRGPWAAAFGRATGRFGAAAFVLQENGQLRCPAGTSLWLSDVRQENAFTEARRSTRPTGPTVNAVLCASSAWLQGRKQTVLVTSVRCVVSCPHRPSFRESRSCSDQSGFRGCSRASPSSHLDRPLAQPIHRGACTERMSQPGCPSPSPTAGRALASPLQRA